MKRLIEFVWKGKLVKRWEPEEDEPLPTKGYAFCTGYGYRLPYFLWEMVAIRKIGTADGKEYYMAKVEPLGAHSD